MADHTAFENETRDRLSRMERELRYWRWRASYLSLATVVVAAPWTTPGQGAASRNAQDRASAMARRGSS